ncbi:MAG: endoribonuclease YbeY [marine bacterium B5-7]|nr:MAG: endoribonuclease YbeY [marine bacterium B5-7]
MPIILDLQLATTHAPLPSAGDFQQWAALAIDSAHASTEITIRLVDKIESEQLNLQYRKQQKPTNVLSFPNESPLQDYLGDLVICAPLMAEEAATQGKSTKAHWAHLVIHGCLHLLGYDHIDTTDAEQMENLEIKLLATLGIDDPYADRDA